MKYIVIFILLTGCAGKAVLDIEKVSDYDFNPTTAILKQLIEEKNETQ